MCHPVLGAHNRVLEVKLSDWPAPDSILGQWVMRKLNDRIEVCGRNYRWVVAYISQVQIILCMTHHRCELVVQLDARQMSLHHNLMVSSAGCATI
jgi:hypothetical protein